MEFGPGLAALLGAVEGLTEFLPVSSTGHLILVGHWLGFTGGVAVSVEISIQLGSILAIIAYERKRIASILSQAKVERASFLRLIRGSSKASDLSMKQDWSYILYRSSGDQPHLWFLLGLSLAFIPAAVIGLLARPWIEAYLFNPVSVAIMLITGGLVILVVEARPRKPTITELDHVNFMTAILVGLAQCFSLIPGVSRSGATIVGGLLVGMERRVATEYSFFLALPTMIAATTYKMYKSQDLLTSADVFALAIGLVVAFFVAWAVIAAFLAFLKQHTLRTFAYYRVVLGAVILMVFG
ncbi:MAG: undecaprenyl-diphosphate phosphatase [Nitrospira sp.]|nr:undecaprenyl-diphosphate phosphatase [Nitrospira sp.]